MPCKHYWVEGRVQGVFYRASTHEQAVQLGITGWVKNLMDGRVELVACGTEEQLAKLETWLYRGPPLAEVEDIEIQEENSKQNYNNFEIRY